MDILLTKYGDLSLGVTGDLDIVKYSQELAQEITFRIQTTIGEFDLLPAFGNRLEELIGELLTPDTLILGENIIYSALAGSPLLSGTSVEVRGVPINATQAIFVISVESDYEPQLYTIPFDFLRGIVNKD